MGLTCEQEAGGGNSEVGLTCEQEAGGEGGRECLTWSAESESLLESGEASPPPAPLLLREELGRVRVFSLLTALLVWVARLDIDPPPDRFGDDTGLCR